MKNYALSEMRWLRFTAFTILYFAQGMPLGFLIVALPAWLASQGASPASVASLVAITTLPWGFKLFSGPLMDRYSFPSMGRRRPWVMLAQGGLFLSLVVMAFLPDPTTHLSLVIAVGFIVNTFAAVQDVAVDGMAIDILPLEERGRANAFMGAGQVLGISASAAVTSTLLNLMGWFGAVSTIALIVGSIFVFISLTRERLGERMFPWTSGAPAWDVSSAPSEFISIFRDLGRVLFLPMSILLTMVEFLNRLTAGALNALQPIVIVQELGYADTTYSQWIAISNATAAVFGLAIGPLIDKQGAERFVRIALGLYIAAFLGIGLLSDWWPDPAFLICALFLTAFAAQIIFVAIIALYMNICWTKVAATHFAIYMALSNLSRSAGAGAYALAVDVFSAPTIFLLLGGVSALALGIFQFFDLEAHQKRLEFIDARYASDIDALPSQETPSDHAS